MTAILTGVAYKTSAEMAKELGPFDGYAKNADHMLRVMRNHRRAAYGETKGYEGLAVMPVPLHVTLKTILPYPGFRASWKAGRCPGFGWSGIISRIE